LFGITRYFKEESSIRSEWLYDLINDPNSNEVIVLDYIHLDNSRLQARHLRNFRPTDERTCIINGKRIIVYTTLISPEKLRIISARRQGKLLLRTSDIAEVVVVGRISREKYKTLTPSELQVTAITHLTEEYSDQEINNIIDTVATTYRVQKQIVRVLLPPS
jgi:hypothetical protein